MEVGWEDRKNFRNSATPPVMNVNIRWWEWGGGAEAKIKSKARKLEPFFGLLSSFLIFVGNELAI